MREEGAVSGGEGAVGPKYRADPADAKGAGAERRVQGMAAAPQDACWDPAEIAERFKKENAQNPHPGGMILAGERRCRLPKGGDDVIREYSSCIAIVLPVMASRPIWHPSDQPGDEVPEPPDACGEDISRVSAVSGGNGKRTVICHSKQRPGRQKTTRGAV